MGGKYEVRYFTEDDDFKTEYTNSWFHFVKLLFTKDVIYFKVIKS